LFDNLSVVMAGLVPAIPLRDIVHLSEIAGTSPAMTG
jgi:hypothetical protein